MKRSIIRKILFILVFFINLVSYAQEANNNKNLDNEYYDFETSEGITKYGERQKEFDSKSTDAYILNQLNGSTSGRKRFIETDFLEKSGFRRTGNVKYRKTETSEKALSVLYGVTALLSLGLVPVPMRPFFEIDYERLPKGVYYSFESIFVKSKFNNISSDVQTIMRLEYMLQIEFCNGILIQDTLNYYTDENINKFEKLILELPDYPDSIKRAKDRFFNELTKIKLALERHKNPSENQLRAIENLKGSINIYKR